MIIKTTFNEILRDEGADWEIFCDLYEINEWCVAEGLATGDEEVELTLEEAKKIGFTINI